MTNLGKSQPEEKLDGEEQKVYIASIGADPIITPATSMSLLTTVGGACIGSILGNSAAAAPAA